MMKRLLVSGLSVVLLSATAVNAQTAEINQAQGFRLTPSQLVDAAYRGRFKAGGIPGFNRFISARFSPEEVVQGAIDAGFLAPETINDRRYINFVRGQLRGFSPHRNND